MFEIKKDLMLALMCWVGCLMNVFAQSSYDIRLKFIKYDTLNQLIDYNLQLRSANKNTWNLADQNYRLFYDSGKAKFYGGVSLLPKPDYQELNLVQHSVGINASAVSTTLDFADNLGFLNFAITLSDLANGGVNLSSDGTWLNMAKLQFKWDSTTNHPDDFGIVWARKGKTNEYAVSYVEIAEWIKPNDIELISGNQYIDLPIEASIRLNIKLFLQGAYDSEKGLMQDSLRKKNRLPSFPPFNSVLAFSHPSYRNTTLMEEQVSDIIFDNRAEKSIVDWIFLELRNKDNPTKVEIIKAALLQRDGQVVDSDGSPNINFEVETDSFFLAIRHRNHLGIRSGKVINIKKDSVDFTNPETLVYGSHGRCVAADNKMLLWGGNADGNKALIFQGGGFDGPDKNQIFFAVIAAPDNYNSNSNYILHGYFSEDVNMDGEVRYQGVANDINDFIFFNVIQHPNNHRYLANFIILEQL